MKITFFALLLSLYGTATHVTQQETSINLQRDGRVVTGPRVSSLVQAADANTKVRNRQITFSPLAEPKLSEKFGEKLKNRNVIAVVVPPGMQGGKYVVGLVVGRNTLPEDTDVTEEEFKYLRRWSMDEVLAKLETNNDQIALADASGDKSEVKKIVGDTRQVIKNSPDPKRAAVYAGYLFAEHDETSSYGDVKEFVVNYRTGAEALYDPAIAQGIGSNRIPMGRPVVVYSGSEDVLTFGELNSFMAKRESSVKRTVEFSKPLLKIWRGRSLIIYAEPTTNPFTPSKYDRLSEYYLHQTAGFDGTAAISAWDG